MAKVYNITYIQSGDQWLASIYAVPGCHAEGATKNEAREQVKKALFYFFDDLDPEFTEKPKPN